MACQIRRASTWFVRKEKTALLPFRTDYRQDACNQYLLKTIATEDAEENRDHTCSSSAPPVTGLILFSAR